jgi:putative Mg2+ transporter-C (MgtC) family protein
MTNDLPHVALNLAAAWGAGSLVGLERSYNGRAAGFRTHALVALASATVMVVAVAPGFTAALTPSGTAQVDATRLAQGVMTGVGFLGAGVIFKEGVSVQGLTTAASIWATAAVGLLCGLGIFAPAALITAAILTTLFVFRWIEGVLPIRHYALAVFRFEAARAPSEDALCDMLDRHTVTWSNVSYALTRSGQVMEYHGSLSTSRRARLGDLSEHLRQAPGLIEFELMSVTK